VGGFNLTLTFEPSLTGVGFVLDPGGRMGSGLDLGSAMNANSFDLTYLAEDFGAPGPADDVAGLTALQTPPGSFTLAHLSFTGASTDPSSTLLLSSLGGYLSDALGNTILNTQAVNGQVCVAAVGAEQRCEIQQTPVPEPGTMALMGLGVAGIAARLRRRVQA
jgi:hypothetical protein